MKDYRLIILSLIIVILFFVFKSQNLSDTMAERIKQKEEKITSLENEMHQKNNEIEELTAEHKEYEDKLYGVGGRVDFPKEIYSDDFVFPIAEEDFIRYTSPYGIRRDPIFEIEMYHRGVDIATVWRAQVVSIADGEVIEHYPPPGKRQDEVEYSGHQIYGGMVRVNHGDFETLYAHLAETNVRTGDEVKAGEFIGRVGDTGKSRGHHLHLEMFMNGENVNPLLYLSELDL